MPVVMSDVRSAAATELLRRHPELDPVELAAVEEQARGQGRQEAMDRSSRVLERLRPLLGPEQLAAVTAVRILDPDAIAPLDDETLGRVLTTLNDPNLTAAPDPDKLAAAQRYLDEIM
jgi:hypothetical protein